MNPVFENYEIPWMDDELSILRDAAQKFFSTQMHRSTRGSAFTKSSPDP